MKIVVRPYAEADRLRLLDAGVHPLLARLYAARYGDRSPPATFRTGALDISTPRGALRAYQKINAT